jgi:hypothetical protein
MRSRTTAGAGPASPAALLQGPEASGGETILLGMAILGAKQEALGRVDSIVTPDRISKMDDAEPRRMRDGIGAADGIKLVEKRADVKLGSMN